MINRSNLIFFILILSVFIFRFFLLINSPLTFFSDDAIYATLTQAWVEKNWQYIFHPAWPPLFPALSALVYLFIPNFETALRAVSILAGTIIIVPLLFLMDKYTSLWRKAAFILASTFSIPILDASMLPLSDMLFTFYIITGIVVFFTVFKYKTINNFFDFKKICLGSICFGLAYLVRSESLVFLIMTFFYILFFLLINFIFRKKIIFKPILIIFSLIFIFFITISPYIIATRLQLGFWTLSQKFSSQIQIGDMFALNKNNSTWLQEVASVKSPNYKSSYFKNGNKYIIDRLDYFLMQFNKKLASWQTIFLSLFPKWSIIFITLGTLGIFRKKAFYSSFYIIFLMFTIIPITMFSTVVAEPRYLLWAFPLLLYLFYTGIDNLWQTSKKIFNIRKNLLTKTIIFVAIFLPFTFPFFSLKIITNPQYYINAFTKLHNKTELREAGIWIKQHALQSNPKIMMSHEAVAFYAGGETIYTPQIEYPDLLEFAKRHKVDFFVAWTPELGINNDLAFLLNQNLPHPGLTKLYSTQRDDYNLIIYSLTNEP